MTPVCYLYDMYFKNLIQEHVLGTSEDANGMMNFALMDTAHDMHKARIADNAEPGVFTFENLEDVVTMPVDGILL